MSSEERVVVLGAGQAGGQAAVSLRQFGYEGEVLLIGDEDAPPYQRPPLSKAYLKGDMERERLFLKPVDFYAAQNITLETQKTANSIDKDAKTVTFEDGSSVSYSKLIISTGSRPRALPLPGADLGNVLDLRTLSDVDQLKPLVGEGMKAIIVGAGYIGLEAAAVMRQMGMDVTVLEMADRVLARVTSPVMSEFYQRVHGEHGVKIMLGASLSSLEGDAVVKRANLSTGETMDCDLVLVGIGILPNQELAVEAGIACDNGVIVNDDAMTSETDVYAAGDCARRPLVHYGREGRLESVHNAIEQGKLAAAHICGKPHPKEDVPWFWSDQYDVKLQIAGLSQDADQIVTRGDNSSNSFAVFYFKEGALIAVDAVNSAPEFLSAKRIIAQNLKISAEDVADTSKSMKEILAAATA